MTLARRDRGIAGRSATSLPSVSNWPTLGSVNLGSHFHFDSLRMVGRRLRSVSVEKELLPP
jgi:hypothetical protein